jgi:SAM-dependent methyltransferase
MIARRSLVQSDVHLGPSATVDSKTYWDEHARKYDSLYTSAWCQLEDRRVASCISLLALPPKPVVLDIGCGTGFALRQLSAAGIVPRYFGFDISSRMIECFDRTGAKFTSIVLSVSDLAAYEWHEATRPNLIISTYGSLSFCKDRWTAIRRLAALQKTGDKIFLMALGRYALRRLMRLDFWASGVYRTRASNSSSEVTVFYDRPHQIESMVTDMGYRLLLMRGDGPLCGVFERPGLWKANNLIGQHTTALSHTMILAGEKI